MTEERDEAVAEVLREAKAFRTAGRRLLRMTERGLARDPDDKVLQVMARHLRELLEELP